MSKQYLHVFQIPGLVTVLSKDWAGFCNETDRLLYDDPLQTFSVKTFLRDLCMLDFTEMMNEVGRFQVSHRQNILMVYDFHLQMLDIFFFFLISHIFAQY